MRVHMCIFSRSILASNRVKAEATSSRELQDETPGKGKFNAEATQALRLESSRIVSITESLSFSVKGYMTIMGQSAVP